MREAQNFLPPSQLNALLWELQNSALDFWLSFSARYSSCTVTQLQ